MFKRVVFCLALLLFSTAVSAASGDPSVHKNVSSQRDLFYIDMPDAIHRLEPVTVTVYVNDAFIKEEANAVAVRPNGDNFYSIGKQIVRDRSSSGGLNSFIPYSGEGSFTVGFKANQIVTSEKTSKPNVYFIFYKVKKSPDENPKTSDVNSEFYDMECAYYYNPYYCSDVKAGCVVCVKQLATVWKDYWILPSTASATLPSGFDWKDNRDENLKSNAGYLSYSYFKKDKAISKTRSDGTHYTCEDSYSVALDTSYYGLAADMKYLKDWQLSFNKKAIEAGSATVLDKTGPGGLFPGNAIEVIHKYYASNEWDVYDVQYQLIAQMDPPESGTVKLTMSRKGCAEKGAGKADIDKAISEIKAFGASYSIQYEGAASGFKPRHWYDALQGETVNSVTGRITDGHNNGMPYMTVSIEYDGKNYDGRTDETGNYDIKIPTLQLDQNNPKIGKLKLSLSYVRDGKNYFTVSDHVAGDKLVLVEKNFSLESELDKTQDFDFGTKVFTDTSSSSKFTNLRHLGPIYYHLSEITDFALTELKANIDYLLPVEVYVGTHDGTLYSRDNSSIQINTSDASYGSSSRPDNREYHEFCHHILFSQWNGSGLRGPGDVNHDGYINNGTGDSYTEGFAEFCAMAASKYKKEPKPEIYAGFGSMELNYKAWQIRGAVEELAVNGILWDLYDDNNDVNDTISLPLDKMWAVMKVKRANFYEYYKAFKLAFPDKADGIDKIFIDHGFFADKNIGNGVKDDFEPYRDTDASGGYNVGDFFVDYGGDVDGENMSYTVGDIIGKATNYERVNRSSVVKIPGSYVKASDPNVLSYKVLVHLKNPAQGADFEYNVEAVNGLVYMAPLPEDIEADITITTNTAEYTSDKPYTTTNKEYLQKYYSAPDSQGYFDSHDFEVKPTGVKENDGYDEKGGSTAPTNTGGTGNGEEGGIDASIPLWAIGGGVLVIGGGIFFVILMVVVILVMKKKKK